MKDERSTEKLSEELGGIDSKIIVEAYLTDDSKKYRSVKKKKSHKKIVYTLTSTA